MRLRFAACAGSALRAAVARSEARAHLASRHGAVLAAAACAVAASSLASAPLHADGARPMPSENLSRSSSVFPLQPDSGNGRWSALAGADAADALRSAESLVTLAGDSDTHAALLSSGAIAALGAALERALDDTSDAAQPLAAQVLHALADLARTNPSASDFHSARIPLLLARTLHKFPVPTPDPVPWGEWVVGLFGFTLSSAPAAAAESPAAALPSATEADELPPLNLDALALSAAPRSDGGIATFDLDLRPGIAYHATRCLSNLARDSGTHSALLDAGLLDTAAAALYASSVRQLEAAIASDAQLLDTLRCLTLSVAALGKSGGDAVVAAGAHTRLLEFAAARADPVAQAYAAAGVRNLVRHPSEQSRDMWQTQRDVVVAGAPAALSAALATDNNPQAQTFAALALGDLLTSGHHKAHLIRKRLAVAFKDFARLLNSPNAGVARAAMRVVHAVYTRDAAPPPSALSEALASTAARLVQGPLARGDVLAMSTAASMAADGTLATALAAGGAIEALRVAVARGRGPYFEEATRALAALAAHPDLAPRIGDLGALDAAAKRPSVERGGLYSAQLFANLARVPELRAKVAHASIPALLLAAHAADADAQREAARALYNLTLSGMSRVMVAQGDSLIPLVRLARSDDELTRRCAVGALAGVAENIEFAARFVEAGALNAVLNAAERDPETRRDVARALANLASTEAVHGTLAAGPAVKWLADTVIKGGGKGAHKQDTMYFASIAVCNLAFSPGITRARLRECGVVSTLAALASAGIGAPDVAQAARQALVNLRGEKGPCMIAVDVTTREFLPA